MYSRHKDDHTSNISKFNILSEGEPQSGTSCLIQRYVDGEYHEIPNLKDSWEKEEVIDTHSITLKIWDTPNRPRHFREIKSASYSGGHAIWYTFDLTKTVSLRTLKLMRDEVERYSVDCKALIFIGTKADSVNPLNPPEWFNDLIEFFKENKSNNVYYTAVSAKTGYNVDNLFKNCAALIAKTFSPELKIDKEKIYKDLADKFQAVFSKKKHHSTHDMVVDESSKKTPKCALL